ncbi:hypothetical protein NMY22_g13343 [Coprinellus aureogranulatus]|nr:hypothetical protein NMY22_g13343 [Coprinellus aureogranulatus]
MSLLRTRPLARAAAGLASKRGGTQTRSNSNWHEIAKAGFGVGNEQYNKFRPSYPEQPIAQIREAVRSPPPLNVAELGSGSGIFTRNLLTHPAWAESIGRLEAVEPSEGMRKSFVKSIQDPRVVTIDGTFDKTNLPDHWADVLIIAQVGSFPLYPSLGFRLNVCTLAGIPLGD